MSSIGDEVAPCGSASSHLFGVGLNTLTADRPILAVPKQQTQVLSRPSRLRASRRSRAVLAVGRYSPMAAWFAVIPIYAGSHSVQRTLLLAA